MHRSFPCIVWHIFVNFHGSRCTNQANIKDKNNTNFKFMYLHQNKSKSAETSPIDVTLKKESIQICFDIPLASAARVPSAFYAFFRGVQDCCGAGWGSGGRQSRLTRAAGFEARLRGEAEQPSDAWHPAGLRCTRGARAFDF